MLKKIVLKLKSPAHQAIGQEFQKRLEAAGLTVSNSSEECKGILWLTDDRETAEEVNAKDIPLIYYEEEGEHFFWADMVIQGLEEVEADFLDAVYKRHYGLPLTIGITERLLIRETTGADLDSLYMIYEGTEADKCICPLEKDRAIEEMKLKAYIKNMYGFYGYGLWSVLREEDGKLIGRAGLEHGTYKGKTVIQVGYLIASEERSKGYGEEACRAIVSYAIQNLDVKKVYIFTDFKNHPSMGLAEKLQLWAKNKGLEIIILENKD